MDDFDIEKIASRDIVTDDKDYKKKEKVLAKKQKKTRFEYEIENNQKLKEKGLVDAESKEEVIRFLENDGNRVLKIKEVSAILTYTVGGDKFNYATLAFVLTQLSTYLKAGVSLIDSVKILSKQTVKSNQKRIFLNIALELNRGESLSTSIETQKNVFPILLINMIKTAELTGDLPAVLDDMAQYYTSIDRTRKAAFSAMTYPIIIFIISIMVVSFLLIFVVPGFIQLFESNDAQVPGITKIVLSASSFLSNNAALIVIGIIIFISIYSYLFTKVKSVRKFMQTVFMKIPVFGNVMIYKEVTMFTKTFASLLSHNVFITDSMAILSQISSNVIFSEIINESLTNLSKGARISDAFKGRWAFPIVAYEMLVTGENTGKLATMMDYVGKYYEDLHSNYTKRLNTLIEPLMILLLALVVGIVLLAVVVPMFSFYSQVS